SVARHPSGSSAHAFPAGVSAFTTSNCHIKLSTSAIQKFSLNSFMGAIDGSFNVDINHVVDFFCRRGAATRNSVQFPYKSPSAKIQDGRLYVLFRLAAGGVFIVAIAAVCQACGAGFKAQVDLEVILDISQAAF